MRLDCPNRQNKTFYPIAAEWTFFSGTRGTFYRRDHMINHKTHLKFKQSEFIPSVFPEHNSMKLEITEFAEESMGWRERKNGTKEDT